MSGVDIVFIVDAIFSSFAENLLNTDPTVAREATSVSPVKMKSEG